MTGLIVEDERAASRTVLSAIQNAADSLPEGFCRDLPTCPATFPKPAAVPSGALGPSLATETFTPLPEVLRASASCATGRCTRQARVALSRQSDRTLGDIGGRP